MVFFYTWWGLFLLLIQLHKLNGCFICCSVSCCYLRKDWVHYENHLHIFCAEILENERSALLVIAESGLWRSDYRMLSYDSMTGEVQWTFHLSFQVPPSVYPEIKTYLQIFLPPLLASGNQIPLPLKNRSYPHISSLTRTLQNNLHKHPLSANYILKPSAWWEELNL